MKLMISPVRQKDMICAVFVEKQRAGGGFVATEYGAAVMEPMAGITVHEGRLDEQEMEND